MFKRIVSVLVLALVLFSAFASASPALADSDGNKVEGTIAAVDTTASTVTITPKKGGADVVVNVDVSTRIKRNGKSATLADLLVGDKAEAKYNPSTMLASKIEAKSQKPQPSNRELKGAIASVDTAASTVTVTPSNGGADVILKVDASTIIQKNHKIVKLDALVVGDQVEAKYNSATMLALKIEVKSQISQSGNRELKGTIASVDTAASTVTITPSNGGADVILKVDASTIIQKNHKIVALDALVVGDQVEAKYNSATMLALKIEVKH